ncbi:hypothetical protein O6H91_Y397500 [Diphasiastrum complanatum]|nr:hypothetical protein O6H91_Y397500 [Diphasiastrum complanatum]
MISGLFVTCNFLQIAHQKRGELSSYEESSRKINSSSSVASLSSACTHLTGRRSPGVVARLMGIEFFPDMESHSKDDIDDLHLQYQTRPRPLKEFLNSNGKLPSLNELFEEESTDMEEPFVNESRQASDQEIMAAASSKSVFKKPFHPERFFPSVTLSPAPVCCQFQMRNDSKLGALSRLLAVPWCLSLPRDLSQLARHGRSQSSFSRWNEAHCRKNALYLEDFLQDLGSSSRSSSKITISDEVHSSDLKTDSEVAGDVCRQQNAEQLDQPSDRKFQQRHALPIGMLPSGLCPKICREEYEKTTGVKAEQGKPKPNSKYHDPAEGNRAKKRMGTFYGDNAATSEERGPRHHFGLKGCKSNATGTVTVNMNIFSAESSGHENLEVNRSSPVTTGLLLRSKSVREGGSHMKSLFAGDILIPIALKTTNSTELGMNKKSHLASKEISLPEKRESNQERVPTLHAVSNKIRNLLLIKSILQQESCIIRRNCSFFKCAGIASKGSATSLLFLENLRNASHEIPARVTRKSQVFGVSNEVRAWIEEEDRKIAEHMQKKPDLIFNSFLNNPKLKPGKTAHNNRACPESVRKEEMLQTCLDGSSGSNVTSELKIGEALTQFQLQTSTQTDRMERQQTGLGFDNWPRIISMPKASSENREYRNYGPSSKSIMHFGSKEDQEDSAFYGLKGIGTHNKGRQIISGKHTATSFRAEPFLPTNNRKEAILLVDSSILTSNKTLLVLDPHIHDTNLTSKKTTQSPQGEYQLQPLVTYVKRWQTSYGVSSSLLSEHCIKYHSGASEKLQFEQRMEIFFASFRGISSENITDTASLEQYVEKVLTVAGLLSENYQQSVPSSSEDLVIHPKVFDRLEIQRCMQGAMKALECPPEDAMYALELHYERCQSSRAHYRLLFDCINESLNLSMHRYVIHDTKLILPKSISRLSGKNLVDEVIMSILGWKEAGAERVDGFIGTDMGNVAEDWSDLRQDIADIVKDTECMLLEDVLYEILAI